MYKNKIILLSILIFSFLFVSTAFASDDYSDIDIDDYSDVDIDDSFVKLSYEINTTIENQTLILKNDYKNIDSSEINISKSITVDGCGHTIDANNKSRAFFIDADNVCLKNITFLNGNSDGAGGCIVWRGNNGILMDCNFINNSAKTAGGAVCFGGNNMTFSNCKFSDNKVIEGNYANIGILDDEPHMYITIIGSFAGALYIRGNATINNTVFINNEAINSGGAILWHGSNALIENSYFRNNFLKSGKNDLVLGVNTTLINSTFKNESLIKVLDNYTVDIINPIYDNNSFEELSRLINESSEILFLDNDYEYVGGQNKGILISKPITIDGCGHTLNGNKLSRIFNITSDGVVLKNINFINGNAYGRYDNLDVGGGAIYWYGNMGELINCNFINNSGSGIEDDPYLEPEKIVFDDDGTSMVIVIERPLGARTNEGGAIVWRGDNGYVINCSFENNSLDYPNAGGSICWRGNNGSIFNSKFNNNWAFFAKSVFWMGNDGLIQSSEFSGLDDDEIYIKESLSIVNSIFNNKLKNSFTYLSFEINKTGENTTLTLEKDYKNNNETQIIISNAITIDGNGHSINANNKSRIFFINVDNVCLKNITFLNGNSDGVGGCIVWKGNNGTLIDCNFINNSAKTAGGAVCGINMTFLNCNFTNNHVYEGNYGAIGILDDEPKVYIAVMSSMGGAIYIRDSATIIGSVFVNNVAGVDKGGAIWCGNNVLIKDSLFKSNFVKSNYIDNFGRYYENDLLLQQNTIIINSTFNNKENIVYLKDVDFVDCIFIGENITYPSLSNIDENVSQINNTIDFSRITNNKDLIIYYKSSTPFKVTIYNNEGKLASNEIVKFLINKKVFTVKTDKNGVAKININEKPGTYKITTKYKNLVVKNKISVKSILISKNIVKKVKKTVKFTVKLLNSNGKIFKKQLVKIVFKGKTYKIKTDLRGIASFKLNKNLKIGKYTIKSSYGGLTVFNKVVVKK